MICPLVEMVVFMKVRYRLTRGPSTLGGTGPWMEVNVNPQGSLVLKASSRDTELEPAMGFEPAACRSRFREPRAPRSSDFRVVPAGEDFLRPVDRLEVDVQPR